MKSSKPSGARLRRLWDDSWQDWEFAGGTPHPADPARDAVRRGAADAVFAVPSRLVLAAPIWIEDVGDDLVEDAARLELEVRGLLPRGGVPEAVVLRTLFAHDGRTLVLASIFPEAAEIPDDGGRYSTYEASAFFVPAPGSAITLWREGESLVAAVSQGNRLVYWETLHASAEASEIYAWLRAIAAELEAEGIAAPGISLRDLTGRLVGNPLFSSWMRAGAQENDTENVPVDPASAVRSRWLPPEARERATAAQKRASYTRAALALAACYLAVLAVLGAFIGFSALRIAGLEREAAGLETDVADLAPIARDWRILGPSLEVAFFPIQILRGAVESLPVDGIRLTTFSKVGDEVAIEGESTSASLATEYFETLTQDDELADIRWEMGAPTLLPNNSAQFRIRGALPLP